MNSRNLVYGTILIMLGAAFLARNLGILPGIPWAAIWQLWPIFLIVSGLQLLFPKGPFSILAPIILVLSLLLAIFGWIPLLGSGPLRGSASLDLPQSAIQASFTVESLPFGNLSVVGEHLSTETALVYEGTSLLVHDSDQYSDGSNQVSYTLTGPSSQRWVRSLSGANLAVQLNQTVQWDLDLELLIGSADVDLRGIDWQRASLATAIGSFALRFSPGEVDRTFHVANGIGSLRLHLPRGQSYTVVIDTPSFLNDLEESGFQRAGNRYRYPGSTEEGPTTTILIDAGLTQISVRWIP